MMAEEMEIFPRSTPDHDDEGAGRGQGGKEDDGNGGEGEHARRMHNLTSTHEQVQANVQQLASQVCHKRVELNTISSWRV